jgi:hypothetical protein
LEIANRCCNRVGAGVVSAIEGIERRIGQGRLSAGNSAKLDHAFFIGDRRHGIDHFVGRLLSQEFDEHRTSFDSAHSSKGARCRPCHFLVQVTKKLDHHGNDLRVPPGAPTGIGADIRFRVPK